MGRNLFCSPFHSTTCLGSVSILEAGTEEQKSKYLPKVVAAGADGIMLEVHPDPDNAAVDPLQPINYADFFNLMNNMDAVAKASYNRYILG